MAVASSTRRSIAHGVIGAGGITCSQMRIGLDSSRPAGPGPLHEVESSPVGLKTVTASATAIAIMTHLAEAPDNGCSEMVRVEGRASRGETVGFARELPTNDGQT